MAPLYNELKKLKSPAFSGASLIKSEAQKVLNEIKVILIQRMQEIIDDFDQFKKLSTDTKSVSKEAQEFREGFWN